MKNETSHPTGFVASGHDTETRILEAASELFADRGFRGSTMRDIATAARINEVTIYRYFPAKRDLCWRAVDWKMRQACVTESLISPLTMAGAPRNQLREFCKAALDLLGQEPTVVRLLYFTGLELNAKDRDTVYLRHLKPVLTALRIRLRAWIESGEIRQLDPETALIGITGVLFSQVQVRELLGSFSKCNKSVERLSSEYAELCLSGLQNYQDSRE